MDNETKVMEQRAAEETAPQKSKNRKAEKKGRSGLMLLHVLQHLAVVTAAVLAVILLLGTNMSLVTIDGIRKFGVSEEDYRTKAEFQDSQLFNELFSEAVSDLVCYGAIRGQMETKGRFDAQKVVDVTAFANRYEGVEAEYVTADYYLEDLIKWKQNGFTCEAVSLTGEEVNRFLSPYTTVRCVDLEEYAGGTVSYLNTDLKSSTTIKDISGNLLVSGKTEREAVEANILANRYLSVEGKGVEEYVSSWDEYYELVSNLQRAASDLLINYGEYTRYEQYYDQGNSNVVYFIRRKLGNQVQIFTNMDTGTQNLLQLKERLKEQCSRYVYFDPSTMEYDTNTRLEESQLRYFLNGYEYAYPEDVQLMIGVDLKYPAADCFSQAGKSFRVYVPYLIPCLLGILLCGLVYILLGAGLIYGEGRKYRDKEGVLRVRLLPQDRIPTEFLLLLTAGMVWGIVFFGSLFMDLLARLMAYEGLLLGVAVICALGLSLLVSFIFYSLVRRIKAGTLLKDSLFRRFLYGLRKWTLYAYDHSDLVLRVFIPFCLFVLLNLIPCFLYQLFDSRIFAGGLILVLLIDAGAAFVLYRSALARQGILEGIRRISGGDIQHKVSEEGMHGDNLILARAVNSIGDSVEKAVETSMKDERLKADLITNVSHDIKTPLTSIINYVDLIKREDVQDPKIREYIDVLDVKSQRLKQLTDDLVEASKISSGNIVLQWEKINLVELLNQTVGEFSEKFQEKSLTMVVDMPKKSVYVRADSRRIWRVMENLFNNIYKYAMEGTRVYVELTENDREIVLSLKNISAQPIRVKAEELTERFIRGDESRTTAGSGLGLSIAKNLTEVQKGKFEIYADGDLFKVVLTFPVMT